MAATHIFCTGEDYLEIINIEAPASPFHVGSLYIGNITFSGLTVLGSKCYMVSSISDRLYIIDIRDLENPVLDRIMETGDGSGIETRGASSIAGYGNYIYFSGDTTLPGDDSGYIQVLDVSTDVPTVRGLISDKYASKSRGMIFRYYTNTDTAYVFVSVNYTAAPFSADYGALSSYEVTDPDNPVYRSRISRVYNYSGFTSGQLVGDRIYVNELLAQNYGYAVNVANPNGLASLGSIHHEPDNCRCVAGVGDYSLCFLDDGLYVIDYTTPGAPARIDIINDGDEGGLVSLDAPRAAQVSGSHVYVASYDDDTLWIGNVSDPTNIVHTAKVVNGDGGAQLNQFSRLALGTFVWSSEFIGIPVEGARPLTVQFTDLSTSTLPILSWLWDFGDGNTSTEQNPTHTYEKAGKFTVSLTIG